MQRDVDGPEDWESQLAAIDRRMGELGITFEDEDEDDVAWRKRSAAREELARQRGADSEVDLDEPARWEKRFESPTNTSTWDVATTEQVGLRPVTASWSWRDAPLQEFPDDCPHGGVRSELPPLHEPPGYRRGDDAIWRYSGGGLVPGARDDTLGRRYLFARQRGPNIVVPASLVNDREDLDWVRRHATSELTTGCRYQGRIVAGLEIPRACWNEATRVALGIDAPELTGSQLLDSEAVARIARVSRSTLAAYRSRGLLPEPQFVLGGSALWSRPVIDHWLLSRARS